MLSRVTAIALAVSLAGAGASRPAKVTFYKDVLPILQGRCQACHRPGEVAPMSFLTYADVRPWAKAIREAVLIRKMPPWSADSKYGKFLNDPSLSQKQIDTLVAWADSGALEGDPKVAPQPVAWMDGWNIGQPDVILEMPQEFQVPAAGTIEYQHIIIPTAFTEDKWIERAEVRVGNRAVVHHVIGYIREPGSTWLRGARPGEPFVPDDWSRGGEVVLPADIVAGFAPGLPPTILPEGKAYLVKAGSDLVIQMHYTANGKPAADRTRIGLIFARKPPQERVTALAVHNARFTIPAGAPNYRVDSRVTFDAPLTLLAMMPHMHYRGRAFEIRAVLPTGESKILLKVPRYDFNWQLTYALEQPLQLPKGARLECAGYFDNSANNRFNPDPAKPVRWGDQTWQEMMIGWLTVAFDAGVKPSGLVREKNAAPTE